MSNPEIMDVDDIDPMLSRTGVLSAKKMCAENNDLNTIMISPLFGSFDKFPITILFLMQQKDSFYPEGQKILVKKTHQCKN